MNLTTSFIYQKIKRFSSFFFLLVICIYVLLLHIVPLVCTVGLILAVCTHISCVTEEKGELEV